MRCTALVHSDVVRSVTPSSLGSSAFIVTTFDDSTRASWVAFMNKKSHTPATLAKLFDEIEAKAKKKICAVRTYNGCEFTSSDFDNSLLNCRIGHETTAQHYSAESNGRAERVNRSLVEESRTILQDLQMQNQIQNHPEFWADAVSTVNQARNTC